MTKHALLAVCFVLIFFAEALSVAAPSIVSVSPLPQSISALPTLQIVFSFDMPMDVSTLTSSNISVFGKWTDVVPGSIQIEDNNTRVRFTPTKSLFAGDWITVFISRNVRNQSGENLAKGYSWSFWVRAIPGNLNLSETGRVSVRRQGEGHIQTYGAHGCDLNNDGWSDFFVPNEISNDCRVFMNDSAGGYSSFAVYPIPNGSRPSTNEAADFNADGNSDIAVGNSTSDSVTVFLGNGSGGFFSVRNYKASGGIRGLSVADLDGDGDIDIVTANRSGNNVAVLLNNGAGQFSSPTLIEANGSQETACVTADANGDGVLDLFVGAYASSEIILLLGDGNGGFTFSSKVSSGGGGPWMIAVGDMNNDGNVDVVSANSNSNNTSVIFGNGFGGLAPAVTYATGAFPIAIDVGDIDGDGDLDLVTSNYSGRSWSVFENNGSGTLVNRRSLNASRAGSCATLHDRDNDGDLDMTGIDEEDDLIFLFENRPSTSVSASTQLPHTVVLHNCYPNPFNPSTEIRYELPRSGRVILSMHNLLGEEIRIVDEGERTTGSHTTRWDGKDQRGVTVASGVYFCKLVVTDRHSTSTRVSKVMLAK